MNYFKKHKTKYVLETDDNIISFWVWLMENDNKLFTKLYKKFKKY
jgi:hypothetical protein